MTRVQYLRGSGITDPRYNGNFHCSTRLALEDPMKSTARVHYYQGESLMQARWISVSSINSDPASSAPLLNVEYELKWDGR